MQLRFKFVLLGIVSSALVMGMAVSGMWASATSKAGMNEAAAITQVIRRHMDADMMHDAMRADVLAALVAAGNADSAGRNEAQAKFREHAAKFATDLNENRSQAVPDNLKPLFSETLAKLGEYRAAGDAAIAAASPEASRAAMAAFEARFSALETSNERLSDQIGAWMESTRKRGSQTDAFLSTLSVVLSIMAFISVAATAWLLWHEILRHLASLSTVIARIASGDASGEVESTKRTDEIGILINAVGALRNETKKAFLVNNMVQLMPTPVMAVDVNDQLRITYANPASQALIDRIGAHFPKYDGTLIGRSIDIFHKNPEHQRRLLSDPANLPHRARIRVGEESIDLQISAVLDHEGNYDGAMLVWDIVTDKARLSQDFEIRVQDVVSKLATSAAGMSQIAESVSGDLKTTSGLAVTAASAATQTTSSVQTVAAAAEEMAASIREISDQVQTTHRLVADSFQKVLDADELAQKLAGASDRVMAVTTVIADISSQTNLLALNATIESARAGEAGRGFSVVASEVKSLAGQTHRSIGEINAVIDDMRLATREIIDALAGIRSAVEAITQATTSVAAAVEEQTATTQDIARNMAFAADGTRVISDNLGEVSSATAHSEDASLQLFGSSQMLSDQAQDLRTRVADFLIQMNRAS